MSEQDGRPTTPPLGLGALEGLVVAIDHVGIAVPDLDAAVSLWATFGLRLDHEEVNEEQGVREAMLVASGDGATSGGARLQLLAPTSPDSTIARFLDTRGAGLQQLAVTVTDVEAAIARLLEAGVRVLYETPRRGTADSRITFVHPKDAGGVLLELVEPPQPHPPT